MCSEQQQAECLKLLQQLKLQSETHHTETLPDAHSSPSSTVRSSASDGFNFPPPWPLQQNRQADTSTGIGKLAVQTTKREGRQLVAAQTLPAGLPVWTEQPYAHVLYRQHIKQVVCCTALIHRKCMAQTKPCKTLQRTAQHAWHFYTAATDDYRWLVSSQVT